jgi:flagellar motor switch protein FliM
VPEVLSQAEIEALLAGLPAGEAEESEEAGPEPDAPPQPEASDAAAVMQTPSKVKSYNFRSPSKFSRDQLRALQLIHEDWGRQLSTTFAAQLRAPIHFDVVSVQQLPYHEFMALLTDSIIYIYSADILDGPMILEVNQALGYWLFERLMGGHGGALASQDRNLTEIEGRVIDNIADKMLGALGEAWQSIAPMRPRIEQREVDPQFVQIVEPAETVVAILMEVKVGDETGTMNVCLPAVTLEKVAGDLSAERWRRQRTRPPTPEMQESLKSRVERTKATLTVILGHTSLTPKELLDMREGDVIPLDAPYTAPLLMKVEHLSKFLVRPGVVGRKLAVNVTHVLSSDTGDDE